MTWTPDGRSGQSVLLVIDTDCPTVVMAGYSWAFDNLAIRQAQIQRRDPVCAGADNKQR